MSKWLYENAWADTLSGDHISFLAADGHSARTVKAGVLREHWALKLVKVQGSGTQPTNEIAGFAATMCKAASQGSKVLFFLPRQRPMPLCEAAKPKFRFTFTPL